MFTKMYASTKKLKVIFFDTMYKFIYFYIFTYIIVLQFVYFI